MVGKVGNGMTFQKYSFFLTYANFPKVYEHLCFVPEGGNKVQ